MTCVHFFARHTPADLLGPWGICCVRAVLPGWYAPVGIQRIRILPVGCGGATAGEEPGHRPRLNPLVSSDADPERRGLPERTRPGTRMHDLISAASYVPAGRSFVIS